MQARALKYMHSGTLSYLHSRDFAIEGCDVQWGVVVCVSEATQLEPRGISNQNLTGDNVGSYSNYCSIISTLVFEHGNETTHLKNRVWE